MCLCLNKIVIVPMNYVAFICCSYFTMFLKYISPKSGEMINKTLQNSVKILKIHRQLYTDYRVRTLLNDQQVNSTPINKQHNNNDFNIQLVRCFAQLHTFTFHIFLKYLLRLLLSIVVSYFSYTYVSINKNLIVTSAY